MNWGNAAIGKINSVLHGLEATIAAGDSTITDPAFKDGDGKVRKFSLVLANFPFSDEFWWLKPEQQTDDKKKKDKLKKRFSGKEGYKDPFGRFGRARPSRLHPPDMATTPLFCTSSPLAYRQRPGEYRLPAGRVVPWPAGDRRGNGRFDAEGNPKIKRRKADDEHPIRKTLLESRLIDAVISLPLNVFYGAGVPACLLILKKQRARRDATTRCCWSMPLAIFRELSNQNELRPQDVMRMLVHVHAYGDAARVPGLVAQHSQRIREQINAREHEAVERLEAEYTDMATRLARLETQVAEARAELAKISGKTAQQKAETALAKLETQRDKAAAKIAEQGREDRRGPPPRRGRPQGCREQVGVELGAASAKTPTRPAATSPWWKKPRSRRTNSTSTCRAMWIPSSRSRGWKLKMR